MDFTIPIERVPASFVRNTPRTLPVIHQGEHVATARLARGIYVFTMFQGDLQHGLKSGSLLMRPRFVDETRPGELSTRRYIAIELVPKLVADLGG